MKGVVGPVPAEDRRQRAAAAAAGGSRRARTRTRYRDEDEGAAHGPCELRRSDSFRCARTESGSGKGAAQARRASKRASAGEALLASHTYIGAAGVAIAAHYRSEGQSIFRLPSWPRSRPMAARLGMAAVSTVGPLPMTGPAGTHRRCESVMR